MNSLKPAVNSPYVPTDALVAVNNKEEAFSNSLDNRTISIARIILNDNGREVVLEGKEAEAYIVGSQFLTTALEVLFSSAMDAMLDFEMLKYLEEGRGNQTPLLPNSRVEELDPSGVKLPPQQSIQV